MRFIEKGMLPNTPYKYDKEALGYTIQEEVERNGYPM